MACSCSLSMRMDSQCEPSPVSVVQQRRVDVISDFNELNGGGEEGDILRFEGMGIGTFVYLGTGAFGGGSGNSEARISGSQVFVDTNGDGTADITLTLMGLTSANQLAASDFIFL